MLISVICISWLTFSYTNIASQEIDHWLLLVLRCAIVITESAVIYSQLHNKYRMVIYEDSNYKPTYTQIYILYFLHFLFYLNFLILIFLSYLFLVNADNKSGIGIFQGISILILFQVIVYYVRDGFSDYSGHAFCEKLDMNNDQKSERSYLPFSLPPNEMKKYEESYCVLKRE